MLVSGKNVNEVLAQEFQKPVIRNFKRKKGYSRFTKNIWAADLAEMGSLPSINNGVKYSLCIIDVFTKYAWVKSLTDKKYKTFLDGFTEIVNESNAKPRNHSQKI